MTKPIRDSVRAAFLSFTRPLEGSVSTMYLDTAEPEPLVTIGDGYLIDPIERALSLPFVHRDTGAPALPGAIRAEWLRIKGTPELAVKGWRAAQKLCLLMLTQASIERLTWQRFDANAKDLAWRYPGFEEWPASAQLGTMSLAWAGGSGFEGEWPKCAAYLRAGDFRGAAREATVRKNKERTRAQHDLFTAAALVVERGLDREPLYLTPDAVPGADPEPVPDTEPSPEAREAYAASVLGTRAAVAEMSREGRDRDDD